MTPRTPRSVRRRTLSATGLGASAVVVLAAAVVPAYAAGPIALAAAGDCPSGVEAPCVIVSVQDGDRIVDTVAIGSSDVLAPADGPGTSDYVVYRARGDRVPAQTCVGDRATRLSTLLSRAVGAGRQVQFAEVIEDDGSAHVVARDELDDASLPAIVCDYNGTSLLYLRSARDEDDLNGAPGADLGQFSTGQRQALLVTAHLTGELIRPEIAVTEDADNEAAFTFSADGVPPGATYAWSFGDGDRSGRAAPDHEYTSTGSFLVGLEVTRPDGSFGNADTYVAVGTLPSGPPATGVTTPTPTVGTSSPPGGSPSPTGGSSSPGAGTPSRNPATDPDSLDPSSPATVATSSASGAPSATGTASSSGTAAPVSLPTLTPSTFLPPVDPAPPGSVSGVLLQAFQAQPGGAADAARDVLTEDRATSPDQGRLDPRLLLVAGILALLAAGAASETPGVNAWLRRRRPWSRMAP